MVFVIYSVWIASPNALMNLIVVVSIQNNQFEFH